MPELRQDPATEEWGIIAIERAQQPHGFWRAPERPAQPEYRAAQCVSTAARHWGGISINTACPKQTTRPLREFETGDDGAHLLPAQWIFYSYLLAAGAAVFLLLLFRARRWYWHALSLLLGLVVGLFPPPSGNGSDFFYLLAGLACVFFILYGLGAPLFRQSPS